MTDSIGAMGTGMDGKCKCIPDCNGHTTIPIGKTTRRRVVKKYSKNFERDYTFYLSNVEKFGYENGYVGPVIPLPDYAPDGVSAKEAFLKFDGQGKTVPTNNPRLLRDLIAVKKSINFHIKMWCEGYADMKIEVEEYMESFDNPPEWVEKAFRQQLQKRRVR